MFMPRNSKLKPLRLDLNIRSPLVSGLDKQLKIVISLNKSKEKNKKIFQFFNWNKQNKKNWKQKKNLGLI